VLSFVCSVGNVPLAAVLWNGGISFGGVISFLFADLLILPILNIYRKYYGLKVAAILSVVFYVAMAAAALAVEGIFSALHLIPVHRPVAVMQESIRWNYTSVFNLVFLLVSALLLIRFLKTGGPAMLREMGGGAPDPNAQPHSCCHEEPAAVVKSCCHDDPEPQPAMADCCHTKVETPASIAHDCCTPKPTPLAQDACCHAAPEEPAHTVPNTMHHHG
jgi:hypothetical protein